ncbi:MAG: hypothetical protein RI947_738 [Candidatus Parcubacteria bacterium]
MFQARTYILTLLLPAPDLVLKLTHYHNIITNLKKSLMTWQHKAIIGSFLAKHDVENVFSELRHAGYRNSDISIVMSDNALIDRRDESVDAANTGILTGGTIGALAGLIAGIGAITVPGVGPLLAVGPLATALGFTGVGAATGALTGGVVTALIDIGIAQSDAYKYEQVLKQGGVVISVLIDEQDKDSMTQLFKENNATDTQIITPDEIAGITHAHAYPDDDNDDAYNQPAITEKTRIDKRSPYNRTGMYAHKKH